MAELQLIDLITKLFTQDVWHLDKESIKLVIPINQPHHVRQKINSSLVHQGHKNVRGDI